MKNKLLFSQKIDTLRITIMKKKNLRKPLAKFEQMCNKKTKTKYQQGEKTGVIFMNRKTKRESMMEKFLEKLGIIIKNAKGVMVFFFLKKEKEKYW